jgi:hypothetical protein
MHKKKEDDHFNSDHGLQYQNLASDARFYADQRFKVAAVFFVANGLLANITAKYPTVFIGILGIVFSYLCLSWEKRTSQWWAILFEGLKELEQLARKDGKMVKVYEKYPKKTFCFFLKATYAITGIYWLGILGWLIFIGYLVFCK